MKTIAINSKNHTIELPSKKYAAAASKFGTEEYKTLQQARRDYPTYRVTTSSRKPRKIEFAGLTYSYMEKYIAAHDDEEQSIMKEYMDLRAMTEAAEEVLAESASYQEMKDWFLDTFPAVVEYHEKRAAAIEKTRKNKEEKRAVLAQKQKESRRASLLEGVA